MRHWLSHGQRLRHVDGTLGDQIGVLVLAPDSELGIFAASNALPGVANSLLEPVLTHLFGPAPPAAAPTAMPGASDSARRVAGTYRDFHHTRNDMSRPIALLLESQVTAESDGAIRWRDPRWLEVAPLLFTSDDGGDTILFTADSAEEIAALHGWGETHERIAWPEQRIFHLGVLATCMVGFLAYPVSVSRLIRRRRPTPDQGRIARRCAVIVALVNLAFIVWLATWLRGLGAAVPLPPSTAFWLSVPLASGLLTALLPRFAAVAWRKGWWTRGERIGYTTFTALAVGFMVFLNYWKVLGVRM